MIFPFLIFGGATGIGINGEAVDPGSITSWADFWKPEYKNSLLMMDDAREVFQVALTKLGYSGNTTDPKEIEEAYKELQNYVQISLHLTLITQQRRLSKVRLMSACCGMAQPLLLAKQVYRLK